MRLYRRRTSFDGVAALALAGAAITISADARNEAPKRKVIITYRCPLWARLLPGPVVHQHGDTLIVGLRTPAQIRKTLNGVVSGDGVVRREGLVAGVTPLAAAKSQRRALTIQVHTSTMLLRCRS